MNVQLINSPLYNKSLIRTLTFLCLIVPCLNVFAETTLDNGNYDIKWYKPSEKEFFISTRKELAGIAYLVNNGFTDFKGITIKLSQDIELYKSLTWIGIGNKSKPFKGIFDGQNHKIQGFVNKESGLDDCFGIFNCISNGMIKNLTIEGEMNLEYQDAYFPSTTAGMLCGYANNSNFENCQSLSSIVYYRKDTNAFDYPIKIGGLIGKAEKCSFKNCFDSSNFKITFLPHGTLPNYYKESEIQLGGLIGNSYGSQITFCAKEKGSFEVNVGQPSKNINNIWIFYGGLVGYSSAGSIKYCYNNTEFFKGKVSHYLYSVRVGGITGYAGANVNKPNEGVYNCYSSTILYDFSHTNYEIKYGGIAGTYDDYLEQHYKANFSPSDISLSMYDYTTVKNGYFGSTSFKREEMKSEDFLTELNLYPNINGENDIWTLSNSEFPTFIKPNSGVKEITNSNISTKIIERRVVFDSETYIRIYSLDGTIVYSGITTETPELPKGIYILQFEMNGIINTSKVAIQ